jgi:hypothetical protein
MASISSMGLGMLPIGSVGRIMFVGRGCGAPRALSLSFLAYTDPPPKAYSARRRPRRPSPGGLDLQPVIMGVRTVRRELKITNPSGGSFR